MRISQAIAVFLAYAATVVAADVSDTTPALASPSVAETPTASVKGHDPANLSALYTPPPDPVAPVATLSGPVTIGITNRLAGTPALSIVGASNAGVKPPLTPVSGQFSRTTNIVVPSGWAGAFTVDRVGAPFNAQGTRIEGNWGVNDPFNQIYLDISYVTGFSVPIVCSCGANSTAIADFGCNKELFNLGTCPYGQLQGRNGSLVCVNWSPTSGPPQDFFAPVSFSKNE